MPFSHNVNFVAYDDLNGHSGFKLAIHERDDRFFLYVAALWEPGLSVIEVTDPTRPRFIRFIDGPPSTWTIQVQVAEGRMITSMEAIPAGWGDPGDSVPPSEGFLVWSLDDPSDPQLVGHWRSGSTGTHRNYYAGGRYVHTATTLPGFHGQVYGVVDIDDPEAPSLVGRWWYPGQHIAAGETFSGTDEARLAGGRPYILGDGTVFPGLSLHAGPIVQDDRAYCAWMRAGMIILDVSDPTRPKELGSLSVYPPLGSSIATHTAQPIPGTDLVVLNSEALNERAREPANFIAMVDASDPSDPVLISFFPVPDIPPDAPFSSFASRGGRFGPHNQHQPQGQACLEPLGRYIHTTYFNAGLQIFDITDAFTPRIAGYYIPDDPVTRRGPLPSDLVVQVEDVIVDRRGYIYFSEKNSGVTIVKRAAELPSASS